MPNPSIVWDGVVAMVRVEELELEFLIQGPLPGHAIAWGNVSVVAEVPLKQGYCLSGEARLAEEKILELVIREPRTSKVELGLVVPIPTCANEVALISSTADKYRVFIMILFRWILMNNGGKS
ncbi:MAG: hypothetical protein H0X41_07995 [Chitinophagaceae bacterium]|nr:hypothetical protein [Chitinophagaceae bacterium]